MKYASSKGRGDRIFFHAMLFIPVSILLVYLILPIPAGVLMAFQDFQPATGFFGSKFAGLRNFERLFRSPDVWPAVRNTLIIAVSKVAGNLAIPITFALLLNEIGAKPFKRMVQTVTYLPFFLSWVILAGILIRFLSPGSAGSPPGILNTVLMSVGAIREPIYFLGSNDSFRQTMIVSDIWKNFGYNTIIYLAALTSLDPTLYEAAQVDGAGRLRQALHITLPGIAPFIALMTILAIGKILNAGFDQIFNLYSPAVYETGDVIDTMVYRLGLVNRQYSLSAVASLLRSSVSCVLVLTGYRLADKYAGYKVW
ncbi:MAG: ABC transporter permease subunit [Clostridiales bacterium]|jgi:putative aldouronate transport system permease protein|nr:ABC transporter permease subunit [Clostridiales bacterium]